MARYPSIHRSRRRGRGRKWIYITSLVIIAVAIAAILRYHPFGKSKDETVETLTPDLIVGTDVKSEIVAKNEVTLPAPQAELELAPDLIGEAPWRAAEPNPKATELIAEATAFINAKPSRIIEARDRLNEALPMRQSRQQRRFVKKQLSELADKWLFSRTIFPQDRLCKSLQVKPGDLLSTIGKQHKVPYEILMEINKILSPEALRAGETIKVINGPFHARIYRSTFTMDLYLQNTFVRSFPVGLGQPGMETPMGLWVVKPEGKLITPIWTDPISGKTYEAEDPDYPLGSRWIGLKGIKGEAKDRTGFAIHGTKDPDQIGTAGSQGCIRLHNGDAILMYNLLVPGFSRVEVVE